MTGRMRGKTFIVTGGTRCMGEAIVKGIAAEGGAVVFGGPLHMNGADVERLGLFEGDPIRVSTEFGSIDTHVLIDESLRQGAVAMAHGNGQARSFAMRIASQNPGSNCNDIMPNGPDSFEPLSHMAWLSAVPVTVIRRAAGMEVRNV